MNNFSPDKILRTDIKVYITVYTNFNLQSLMTKKTRLFKITGYIILSIACLMFLLMPVVPFLDLSPGRKAGITTGLFIAGEVLFYLSLVFLGRSFYDKIKKNWKFWKKKDVKSDIWNEVIHVFKGIKKNADRARFQNLPVFRVDHLKADHLKQ